MIKGAGVDYLITGNKSHLSRLYSKTVCCVYILSPTAFLDMYNNRLLP